ncbi:MAG: S8 family peptidase [Thermoleophilia bacterium]
MTKKFPLIMVVFAVLVAMSFPVMPVAAKESPVRKIVVFDTNFVNEKTQDELIEKVGGVKIKNLNLINAKAVYLPNKDAEKALLGKSGISRIDDDVIVDALAKPGSTTPTEVLPWGVDRIEADQSWSTTLGSGIKVAVLDTGIDLTHPDLEANIKGGYNAINPARSYADDNGHGTHVAGIIGAIDNEIGIIGTAPLVNLYAIKALDRRGSGYLSDIIEGLDWAVANQVQVINMSLGTNSDVVSFHNAVQKVNQAGIIQVAAAGNDGGAVDYPAAYSEVIAVSATDSSDNIASWSSRGAEVDLAAPGVSIFSSYKGSTYKTLSGTSMASAHVAGSATLVLTQPPGAYDLDGDGAWDPAEVLNKLKATATDLGVSGADPLYGAGLVNAALAIQP